MIELKKLWQKKEVRTYVWNIFSIFVWAMLLNLLNSGIEIPQPWGDILYLVFIPAVIAVLKYINKEYFNDLWVYVDPALKEVETLLEEEKEKLAIKHFDNLKQALTKKEEKDG